MKKVLYISAVAAMLMLSGCSQKEPAIDATEETAVTEEVAPAVTTETVAQEEIAVVDETAVSDVVESDTSEMTLSALEGKMQTVNFDFDKFNIRPDMEDRVAANTQLAKGDASAYMIKLEGNCDEWGSDEYNYALGLRRANTIKSAMTAEGVDEKRITMVSYGESNPVCTDKTKDCWAQNRRVDFKLLP